MGEAVWVKCINCNTDYGRKLTGRGIQPANHKLPGYCSTCKLIVSTTAENPVCNTCKCEVALCGTFVMETKKEWIEKHTSYKYTYADSSFFKGYISGYRNYLSFEIDFKTLYACKMCNTPSVQLSFGGMDWD